MLEIQINFMEIVENSDFCLWNIPKFSNEVVGAMKHHLTASLGGRGG